MKIRKDKVKRLLIYFIYDKDGFIDEYIPNILKNLEEHISELIIICNGKLLSEGRNKLENYTENIIVRENKGFDVWAYKEGIEYYGWQNVKKLDELILMNYTLFGPLFPFKNMFEEMNERDVDFWGITKHHGYPIDPFGTIEYGYIPEHIQSSFIAIRHKMLNSYEFYKYWKTMPMINSYGESIGNHEAIFTKKFSDYGFIPDTYINTDDLKETTDYPLMIEALELVKNRKCPVIKRKLFTNNYFQFLDCTTGEPALELYNYMINELDYDFSLIWENILRTDNMADIKDQLHLNYILPKYYLYEKIHAEKKIALFLHLYSIDEIDKCLEYTKSMPQYSDIYITTDTKYKKKIIHNRFSKLGFNKLSVSLVKNQGRDVSALLIGFRPFVNNYDYVCFIHDNNTTQIKPLSVSQSFSYKCFENLLASNQFVENIISTFENNPKLGMLMPPPPNHGGFFGILGDEWTNNYNNTIELAKKFNLNVNIDKNKEPISPLGTMFWFRPNALKPIFNYKWKYEDFPEEPVKHDGTIIHAIEILFGFIIQDQGYYPAWVLSDQFAKIELTNLHFMLRETIKTINNTLTKGHYYGYYYTYFQNLLNNYSLKEIIKFKIKQRTPSFLWNFLRNIYHVFKK